MENENKYLKEIAKQLEIQNAYTRFDKHKELKDIDYEDAKMELIDTLDDINYEYDNIESQRKYLRNKYKEVKERAKEGLNQAVSLENQKKALKEQIEGIGILKKAGFLDNDKNEEENLLGEFFDNIGYLQVTDEEIDELKKKNGVK